MMESFGEAAHLLLGDELGQAVRLRRAASRGDAVLLVAGHLDAEDVVVPHVRHLLAVRGQARIDDARARLQLGGLPGGALDQVELAGERHENPLTVLGQLVGGEAPGAHAHALAAGLLLGGERLLGALEDGLRGEHLLRLPGGHVEGEEGLDGRAGLAPQEEDGLLVGGDTGIDGTPTHEAARLRVVPQEGIL
jgi:hypothetical protein